MSDRLRGRALVTHLFLHPGHSINTIPDEYACFEHVWDERVLQTVHVNVSEYLGTIRSGNGWYVVVGSEAASSVGVEEDSGAAFAGVAGVEYALLAGAGNDIFEALMLPKRSRSCAFSVPGMDGCMVMRLRSGGGMPTFLNAREGSMVTGGREKNVDVIRRDRGCLLLGVTCEVTQKIMRKTETRPYISR